MGWHIQLLFAKSQIFLSTLLNIFCLFRGAGYSLSIRPAQTGDSGTYFCLVNGRQEPFSAYQLAVQGNNGHPDISLFTRSLWQRWQQRFFDFAWIRKKYSRGSKRSQTTKIHQWAGHILSKAAQSAGWRRGGLLRLFLFPFNVAVKLGSSGL